MIEKGDAIGICRNGHYSTALYDCGGDDNCSGRTSYGLSALYNPHLYEKEHQDANLEPFLETMKRRGDSGASKPNQNDAGCRHLSFYNLPDQINSMCFFNQNVFTGKKYIQNMIAQMEDAPYVSKSKGAGVSFLDATPNIAMEASFS